MYIGQADFVKKYELGGFMVVEDACREALVNEFRDIVYRTELCAVDRVMGTLRELPTLRPREDLVLTQEGNVVFPNRWRRL